MIMDDDKRPALREVLQRLRAGAGLTQVALGERMDVPKRVSRYECGEMRRLPAADLLRWLDVVRASVETRREVARRWLCEGDDALVLAEALGVPYDGLEAALARLAQGGRCE